jgi:hypothetical protein
MQTFMPYESFLMSIECLDTKRLCKQRVEAMQIHNIISGKSTSNAWRNHPAVKMWRGYQKALAHYHNLSIYVWKKRGYKNTMKFIDIDFESGIEMPWWYGNKDFHDSHKSNLLRKDPVWYGKFRWNIANDMPYVWPVR